MKSSILISGAGTGIGRPIVQELDRWAAGRGEPVSFVLLGRNLKALEETRKSLRNPKTHHVVSVDLRDEKKTSSAFKRIRPALENLRAVIANAGAGGENHGPDRKWTEIIDTNLTGSFRLIHESLPALRRSRHRYKHVITISSQLARTGCPGHTAYCASKAGQLGLTRALALELAPEKILVNAICPGIVRGGMSIRSARTLMKDSEFSENSAYALLGMGLPLGKVCEPEEIARLIGFLISEDQVSATGQSFEINNGAVMP